MVAETVWVSLVGMDFASASFYYLGVPYVRFSGVLSLVLFATFFILALLLSFRLDNPVSILLLLISLIIFNAISFASFAGRYSHDPLPLDWLVLLLHFVITSALVCSGRGRVKKQGPA